MANNLTFLNGLVNTVLEAESFFYFRNAISASYGNFTSYTYVQESGSWFVCSEISPDFILTYRIIKGTAEETTFLAETGSVNQFVPRKRILQSTVSETDEKVKVTSNDTTSDYLFNKISAGPNISLTEVDDSGNESLMISASFNESTDVDSLNGQTGVVNIVAGPNVNVGADNGNVAVSASTTTVNTFSGTVTLTAGDDINIVNNNGNIAISSTFVESADVDSLNGLQGTLTLDAGPNVNISSGGTSVAVSASVTTINSKSGSVTLTAGPNITINTVGQDISITGSASGVDEKVKVSSNDTTEDYLFNKLIAGPKITLTEANDGFDEKIVISSSFSGPFSGSKSGFLTSSLFFGSPRSGTVVFDVPYVDANYSVVVQGENSSLNSTVTRVFTVVSKTSASFVAKMGSSRMKDFLGISWQTMPNGESN